MEMEMYVVLIIPPDSNLDDMQVIIRSSYLEAENLISDCKRCDWYEGYQYIVRSDYIDLEITLK